MYGINGQPMLDLDAHIDVARFASLKNEMDVGLAKSMWEPGSFGPGVYEKQLDKDLFYLEEVLMPGGRHPDAEQVMAAMTDMPTLTERRRYLKLRYGLYNSSYSVYLRRPKNNDYAAIDNAAGCAWTADEKHFPRLRAWIEALPFEHVGRVLFFVNEHLCPVAAHSDLKYSVTDKGYVANHPHAHEFIWIRPTIEDGKRFFVLDEASGQKHYVAGHSCWFNTFDVHGADASPIMIYSLRVDGVFTTEFRRRLGVMSQNQSASRTADRLEETA